MLDLSSPPEPGRAPAKSTGRRVLASVPLIYWAVVGLIAFLQPPAALRSSLAPLTVGLNLAAMASAPVLAVLLVRAFFHDAPQSDKAWLGAGVVGGIASWAFLLWLLRGILGAFGGV